MSAQGNGAIPGWGSEVHELVPRHDAATVMDGIRLGLGMAIAWLVLVPLIVLGVIAAIGNLS